MWHHFYTIFGTRNNIILPCGFILLPSKKETIYDELFKALKKIIEPDEALPAVKPLAPAHGMLDFETGAQNSVVAAFAHIDLHG